jgi:hypothetical protein
MIRHLFSLIDMIICLIILYAFMNECFHYEIMTTHTSYTRPQLHVDITAHSLKELWTYFIAVFLNMCLKAAAFLSCSPSVLWFIASYSANKKKSILNVSIFWQKILFNIRDHVFLHLFSHIQVKGLHGKYINIFIHHTWNIFFSANECIFGI